MRGYPETYAGCTACNDENLVRVYQYGLNASLGAVYLSIKIRDVLVWIKLIARDEMCHVEIICVQIAEDSSKDAEAT